MSESTSTADAPQTEGEGPDNSDKPPQMNGLSKRFKQTLNLDAANKKLAPTALTPRSVNGTTSMPENVDHFPLPPPDSLIKGEKQPGLTRAALEMLAGPAENGSSSTSHKPTSPNLAKLSSGAMPLHDTPSPIPSPVVASPTESYYGGDNSAPPSRPPSKPASRAPSMSAGVSGNKILPTSPGPAGRERRGSKPEVPVTPVRPGKPASIHSDKGDGHKFTLKDLLSSGPKLSRKSSQRSTSSRRSDSDAGEGRARSTAGDSQASLSQKYGVCQKVAIGKGATSVVRLAHKWDRTEEKLYAVKEFRKRRKNESEKEYVKKLTAEFCISSTLHHPNVVETVDLVQDESMNWCEVMEFCPGGDLYAAIKKGGMSPAEVECCFKQMLKGLAYLHGQGVAHRDIKPENLFFDIKGQLKIGDYGASTVYRLPWEKTVHMSSGLCGSEPYIAPEQFLNKRVLELKSSGIGVPADYQ
ncbi:hypothetical protein H1R20_g10225, partial [Candolleomyces eurysporus]